MKNTFGRSAAWLAAIGVAAKLIGALYRVPLTNMIGAQGMGLYQTVFPVYTLLLALCGGGITGATSRTVAKYTARGDDDTAARAVMAALFPVLLSSLAAAGLVVLLRKPIARIQGNAEVAACYIAIAPSLLFSGVICVLRGYFQGRSNMLPSGISQLIEQTVKLALGLIAARAFARYGVSYAVMGALCAVTAGELMAACYLAVRYIPAARRRKRTAAARRELVTEAAADAVIAAPRPLLREIYSFALPVALGAVILPLVQMIDSALVVNILVRGGASRAEATALFGALTGPVATLVNMPTVALASVSVAFLPALTSAVERGGDGRRISVRAARWTMLAAIPAVTAFLAFPDRIICVLYSRGLTAGQMRTASRLLRLQAVTVFYVGALQLATAALQARGRARLPVIGLAIGAAVKVALTPVLVRAAGIYGAAAATTAMYGVAAAFTCRGACAHSPICAGIKDAFLLPLALSAMSAGAGLLAMYAFSGAAYFWQTAAGAGVFVAVYGAGLAAAALRGRAKCKAAEKTVKKWRS